MNLVLLTSRSFHIDCPVLRLRVFIVFLLKGWCLCLILHIFCLGRFTEMVDLVPVKPEKVACLWGLICALRQLCVTHAALCSVLYCITVSRLLIAPLSLWKVNV